MLAPLLLVAATAAAPAPATPATSPIPFDAARRAFEEVRLASEEDGGRLWGKPLDGPILFVDPTTRAIVANHADAQGALHAESGLFVGTLPPTVGIANTALDWSGTRWTMVMWDEVAEQTVPRRRLLLHECFHRIQDEIGLPMTAPDNAHLDALDGRYWLLLEMRALAAALRTDKPQEAMADAAAFRARRRTIYPAAADAERALENNEGLAEYTGFALRGTSDEETRLAVARWRLDSAAEKGTLVRSFAYATGPAWGLLLDELAPDWRKSYRATSDLAATAVAAAKLTLPANVDARAALYDGAALRRAEETRAKQQAERVARYRKRLVDGPLLLIPTTIGHFGFDPNAVVPLGADGNAHPQLAVTGDFGEITSDQGARITADWSTIVFAAEDRARLKLQPGWTLVPGKRPGDLVVAPSDRH